MAAGILAIALFGGAALLASFTLAHAVGRALQVIDDHDRELARRADDVADLHRVLGGRVQRGPWDGWGPRYDD